MRLRRSLADMQKIKSPNIPREFPHVYKVEDNVVGCIVWCVENIGQMYNVGIPGVWYESRGFFFFKNKSDSLRFKLANGCNIKHENVVHYMMRKLQDEYTR